jgi:ferrous iron transport protein A
VTLLDLKIGEKAIVMNESVLTLPLKLVEFGCLPGCDIEVVQFAPFKDPIYIKVNDAYVAIRKDVGVKIQVSICQIVGKKP